MRSTLSDSEARSTATTAHIHPANAGGVKTREELQATGDLTPEKQYELDLRINNARAKKLEAQANLETTKAIEEEIAALKRLTATKRASGSAGTGSGSGQSSGTSASNTDNAPAANAGPNGNKIDFYSTTGSTREQRLAGQNSVDASAQYDLLQRAARGAVAAADLPFAQAVVAAMLNNSRLEGSVNPGAISLAGQASRSRDYQLALRAIEQAEAAQRAAGVGGETGQVIGTPQSVGAAANAAIAASQANTSHTVTINLPNGGGTFNMGSSSDASRLADLLKKLESDMKRAGP